MRACRRSDPRRGRPGLVEPPGEPEVGEIDVLRLVEQDVRRLHVPVHEARGVRGVERRRDLARRSPGLAPGRALPRSQERPEVGAVDEPHREVEAAVDVAGVVDRDHVRMLERHRELGLAGEPLAETLVQRESGATSLSATVRFEPQVVGAVDDAHPAPADHSSIR